MKLPPLELTFTATIDNRVAYERAMGILAAPGPLAVQIERLSRPPLFSRYTVGAAELRREARRRGRPDPTLPTIVRHEIPAAIVNAVTVEGPA